jgi:uncharacterized membrane protein
VTLLDTAKNQVLSAVSKVVEQPRGATAQTVTIDAPTERVEQFWRDPDQLSVVLGDIADVEATGQDRYRWRLRNASNVSWDSRLVAEPGRIRYVGTGDDNELLVSYRAAPRDLGTEVTLRVKTPAPGLLSGAAAYKVLYRLRALMQTGEVPTIKSNPSARNSER